LKEAISLQETSKETTKKPDWRRFIQLVKRAEPPIWLLVIALIMSLATTGVGFIVPLFTKQLVDGFSLESLNYWQIILLGIAFIAQAIASGLSIYYLNRVGHHVVAKLRDQLWRKLLHLPIPYYDENDTGETLSGRKGAHYRASSELFIGCYFHHRFHYYSLIPRLENDFSDVNRCSTSDGYFNAARKTHVCHF